MSLGSSEKLSAYDEQLFKQFSYELVQWSNSYKTPISGNQDMTYYLNLQRKRLEKNGVSMSYKFQLVEKGFNDNNMDCSVWRDEKYSTKMTWMQFLTETTFKVNNKKAYSKKGKELLYGYITNINSGNVLGDEPYICPHCGAESTLGKLMSVCQYCNTCFKMSDLYPKVTNFFRFQDFSQTQENFKKNMIRNPIIGLMLGLLICGIIGINSKMADANFKADEWVNMLPMWGLGAGFLSYPVYLFLRLIPAAFT